MRSLSSTIRSANSRQINFRKQLNLLGLLLIIEAAFLAAPLLVCVFMGEPDWLAFLITVGVTSICGLILRTAIKPQSDNLGRKDGCMITCMVWIVYSLFGMLPFILGSPQLNISEGFFEAMSGFTTTGATVIRDIESCSHGVQLWRALTQWIGGLGIVLFTLAVIPSLNNSRGIFMFHAEVSGITHDKIGARIANTAKILWGLYGVLTLILISLLWIGPMNFFESVCHAFACISTGGFSVHNDSIASYESFYVKLVLTVFMFIGGVNFGLIFVAIRGKLRALWQNDVFRTYLWLIVINYIVTLISIFHAGSWQGWQSLTIDPIFHIVSAMTSTGFGAGNFEMWGELALVLTILMMYFGACAGSTTGGAKIDRLLYLLKNFKVEIKRAVSPRSMKAVRINNMVITSENTNEIIAFLLIYTALILFGGILLSAMDFPIVDAFFSSISCASNNGLGAGVTGVTGSFDFVPSAGKWVMSILMLAGRLEVFALIMMVTPSFWRK
ncbi:MAG: TrkH family potassium uptake protein [Muribaculaceae bacterium]|nr:TrkH family potassium uptake protein [Muribaculaceae bacterium]